MNEAYLCLGGNLGDSFAIFARATDALQSSETTIKCKSSIYKSAPWGMQNAPDFYNQVIEVETKLTAEELMHTLLKIEHQLGRDRSYTGGYESRSIDMDILLFNNDTISADHLSVPHPRMHLRRFVLEPLAEIAALVVHPTIHKTIEELLEECPDNGLVEKINHVA